MRFHFSSFFFLFGIVFAAQSCKKQSSQNSSPLGVYGVDDRQEIQSELVPAILKEKSSGVAVLAANTDATETTDGWELKISKIPFTSKNSLCLREPFAYQRVFGFCTAFLIGEKTMVSAGHCFATAADCANTMVVFDHILTSSAADLTKARKDSIYHCKKIISHVYEEEKIDVTIFELDRAPQNRPLLNLSTNPIDDETDLATIGFPKGLPMKATLNGRIRKNHKSDPFFITNLDGFHGNSGAPVFLQNTGEVAGVYVRGGADFEYVKDKDCYITKVCEKDACQGEEIIRSQIVLDLLANPKIDF